MVRLVRFQPDQLSKQSKVWSELVTDSLSLSLNVPRCDYVNQVNQVGDYLQQKFPVTSKICLLGHVNYHYLFLIRLFLEPLGWRTAFYLYFSLNSCSRIIVC